MKNTFQLDEYVLLVYDRRRRWIKKITEDEFHCNYGMINLKDLVDQPFGWSIKTNTGKWLRALQPTLMDWFDFFEHGSQIIYAKDAAMIIMLLDAKPGDVILEAGTGSGALTSMLSRVVGDTGKVITFEVRQSAHKTALKNHRRLGTTNVTFVLQDITETGFTVDNSPINADAVFLDMGDPWMAVPAVVEALIPGNKLVVFIPTFQQIEKMNNKLLSAGFKDIRVIELIEREIQLKENAFRPATRMIGHTGYLLSAIYIPPTNE